MKEDYKVDQDFAKAWEAYKETWSEDMIPYLDYFVQEEYMFKSHQLCLHRGPIRENLIRGLHSGGL